LLRELGADPKGRAALRQRDAHGVEVATVTYTLVSTTIDNDFITWAALFDTVTNEVCALRERTWAVHVNSAAHGAQKASAGAKDSDPSRDPITAPPFGNAIVNDPANTSTTMPGAQTFIKP